MVSIPRNVLSGIGSPVTPERPPQPRPSVRGSVHMTPAEIVRQKQVQQCASSALHPGISAAVEKAGKFNPLEASTPVRGNKRPSVFAATPLSSGGEELSPVRETNEGNVVAAVAAETTPTATSQSSQPPPLRSVVSSRLPVYQRSMTSASRNTPTRNAAHGNLEKTPVGNPPQRDGETPKTGGEANIATASRALANNPSLNPAPDSRRSSPATVAPVITVNMHINNTPTCAPPPGAQRDGALAPPSALNELKPSETSAKPPSRLLTDDEGDAGNDTNDSSQIHESPKSAHGDPNRSRRQLFQLTDDAENEAEQLPEPSSISAQRGRSVRAKNFYDISKTHSRSIAGATSSRALASPKNGTYDVSAGAAATEGSGSAAQFGQTYNKSAISLRNHTYDVLTSTARGVSDRLTFARNDSEDADRNAPGNHTYDVHASRKSSRINSRAASAASTSVARPRRAADEPVAPGGGDESISSSQVSPEHEHDDSEVAADAEVARVTGQPATNGSSDRSSLSSTGSSAKENASRGVSSSRPAVANKLKSPIASTSRDVLPNQMNMRSMRVMLSPLPQRYLSPIHRNNKSAPRVRESETFSGVLPPFNFRDEEIIIDRSPTAMRKSLKLIKEMKEREEKAPPAKLTKRKSRKRRTEVESDEQDDSEYLSQTSGRRKLYTKGDSEIEGNGPIEPAREIDDHSVSSTSMFKKPQPVAPKKNPKKSARGSTFRNSCIAASSTLTAANTSEAQSTVAGQSSAVQREKEPRRPRQPKLTARKPLIEREDNNNGLRRSGRERKPVHDYRMEIFQQVMEKKERKNATMRPNAATAEPPAKRARTTGHLAVAKKTEVALKAKRHVKRAHRSAAEVDEHDIFGIKDEDWFKRICDSKMDTTNVPLGSKRDEFGFGGEFATSLDSLRA